MSCTDTFCYNIGELLLGIKEDFEKTCSNNECLDVLLPKEREVLMEYVSQEFMDRRTMEIVRCLIQNILKNRKDKSIRQFAYVPRQVLTGRMNPQRNLLTDVRNYDKVGIDMVVSEAKILGSVATILRCNITDFKMDSIRKMLNETTWRLSSSFNAIQQKDMDDLLSVFHNYILGITCANPIRTWTPNTAYTYGMYASQCAHSNRKNFCTMVEKVPSLPQQETVMSFLKNGRMTPDLFLSVFYQLSLTLEMMQSYYGYCHFNLNAENIMMRPVYQQSGNGIDWIYMLYGTQYVLKNIQFVATISDYRYGCFDKTLTETGTLSMDDVFIGMGKFQKYGIMDFMVPGYDMFVFLNSVRNIITNTLDPNNITHFLVDPYAQENNLVILNFINQLLKDMYQLTDFYLDLDNKTKSNYRFYNVLLCKGAGLAPLALVERVVKSDFVKTILQLNKDPLQTAPRNSYVPTICKKKIPLFITDLLPNWKDVVGDSFIQPSFLVELNELPANIDTMLNMIKNKQILFEFDFRPLMSQGGAIATETIDYYDKLVFHPDGYYHGYYQNTLLFYNLLTTFLNTYYYKYYIQDKTYMELFVQNNDKLSILFKYIQQPQFISKIAGMVRFCQTIVYLKSANERNFCCLKRKETLGTMGRQQQKQQRLYQIVPQTTTQCGQQGMRPLRQQKKQQIIQQKKQQVLVPPPFQQQKKQQIIQQKKQQVLVPPPVQQKKQQVAVPAPVQQKKQQVAVPPPVQQKKQQVLVPAPVQQKKQQVLVPPPVQQKKQQTTTPPPAQSSSMLSSFF